MRPEVEELNQTSCPTGQMAARDPQADTRYEGAIGGSMAGAAAGYSAEVAAVVHSAEVTAGLDLLATLARYRSGDVDTLITGVLELIAEILDVGLTFLARLEGRTLYVQRVYDRAGMGMRTGDVVAPGDAFRTTLLTGALGSLVVEDAQADPSFAALFTTRDLAVGACSGVSLTRSDRRTYGILCTLHPEARRIHPGELALLSLAGRVLMQAVEAEEHRRQLAASDQHFRTVFSALASGVLVLDGTGAIIDANAAAQEMLGRTLDQLRGHPLDALYLATAQADGTPPREEERPTLLALRHRRAMGDGVLRLTRLRGERGWARVDIVPVIGHNGEVAQVVVSFIDITARVRAEEKLRHQLAFTKAVTDSLGEGLCTLDRHGKITFMNPFAERLLGRSQQEIRGRPLAELICPAQEDARDEEHPLLLVLRTGRTVHLDQQMFVRQDGSCFPVACTASPIVEDDGVAGLVLSFRDISDQKRVEEEMARALTAQQSANRQLERLNKAKDDFVSILSHEFRTPLTGIQGFSELIRDEDLSGEEIREYADDINSDARRLTRMINEMLDLNRMESGQMALFREQIDLNVIIADVALMARPTAPRHAIRLDLDQAMPHLPGDRDKLTQVFTNLLSNAIKYSPAGGVISVVSRLEDGQAHAWVEDHGVGIPEEALEPVFERYTRVESDVSRHIQGTGLGLPIVRQIVSMHGGRTWAESTPGQGSVFHVALPLESGIAGRAGRPDGDHRVLRG